MSIIQKNVFGDNIIYNVSPNFSRQLTNELQNEIISTLTTLNVTLISIRYEHGAETAEFVDIISQFLSYNGYKVYANAVMMSEIKRNEFSIQKHPSDPLCAIIKIGPLF